MEKLALDFIEACGEGSELYEKFKNVSGSQARKEIALQFLVETSIKEHGLENFNKMIRNKDYTTLTANAFKQSKAKKNNSKKG